MEPTASAQEQQPPQGETGASAPPKGQSPPQGSSQQIPEEAQLSWEWVRWRVRGSGEKGGIREKGGSEGRVGK